MSGYVVHALHELGYGLPEDAPTQPVEETSQTDLLAELERRSSALAMGLATGRVSPEDFDQATALLVAQREQVTASLAAAVPVRRVTDEVFDLAREQKLWEDLSLARRRALLSEIATVTILPVGPGHRSAPIRDRVRIELDLSQWETIVTAEIG